MKERILGRKKQVGGNIDLIGGLVLLLSTFGLMLCLLFLFLFQELFWGDTHLFGLLISSSLIGLRVEEFTWFIVNPFYGLKKWNSKNVYWYPWLKLGRFEIPTSYVLGILISGVSWFFCGSKV